MATSYLSQGVLEFVEDHSCYWFLDVINSYQTLSFRAKNQFQVWKLVLNDKGSGARAICEDGDYEVLVSQRIPFTDYKGDTFVFWYANETIYLPSEH